MRNEDNSCGDIIEEELKGPLGEDIKVAINTAIWMYAHSSTTLKEAEDISIKCYELIMNTWWKNDRKKSAR